ncbi:MAG: 50S ribosomal protein L10 [Alphaproteobacteria bacterium]|nr:50S ribosomal protein L10 [Alphaproteobacteria bacterium]MCL2505107.1 50S ribosomal protein L10 [Alphaproteobacteria bacterium]
MSELSENRLEKEKLVKEIGDEIKDASIIVVNQQMGLNADQTRSLRVAMRAEGVGLKIAKNTLIKRVIEKGPFSALEKFLQGPTVLAFSKDPVAAAKVSAEFSKKNESFKVVGAVMNGELMEAQQVKMLASLPSLDQLRAKIIGLVQAPATKIAGVLQAPAGQLARVMSARSKQGA